METVNIPAKIRHNENVRANVALIEFLSRHVLRGLDEEDR